MMKFRAIILFLALLSTVYGFGQTHTSRPASRAASSKTASSMAVAPSPSNTLPNMTALLKRLPNKPVDVTNEAARDLLEEQLRGLAESKITLTARVRDEPTKSGKEYDVPVMLTEGRRALFSSLFCGQQEMYILSAAGGYWHVNLDFVYPQSQSGKVATVKKGDILKATGTFELGRVERVDFNQDTFIGRVTCHEIYANLKVND